MKIITKVFRSSEYSITSPFGWRTHPITKKKTMHNGTDYVRKPYSTKWPLYAVESGYVLTKGYNSTSGNYMWVRYPRINKSLFHCHLSKISVKSGQSVKEGTLIGFAGTTGSSTGIHLHLGMQPIGSSVWQDVDKYNYTTANTKYNLTRILKQGSKGVAVKNLQKKLRITADGSFGPKTKKAVISFQKKNKLPQDGVVGKNTAHKLGWLWCGK